MSSYQNRQQKTEVCRQQQRTLCDSYFTTRPDLIIEWCVWWCVSLKALSISTPASSQSVRDSHQIHLTFVLLAPADSVTIKNCDIWGQSTNPLLKRKECLVKSLLVTQASTSFLIYLWLSHQKVSRCHHHHHHDWAFL